MLCAGVCVRLYSQQMYQDEMSECRRPAVMETNLSHLVLLLKRLDIADMGQCKFLDRPGEHARSLTHMMCTSDRKHDVVCACPQLLKH